jgi:hypothetical protein
MLHLHGGGFVMGSAFGYRATMATLAAQTGTTVVAPDYWLAPEHPFPAALDDALTAYSWLLDSGVPPNKIIVAGTPPAPHWRSCSRSSWSPAPEVVTEQPSVSPSIVTEDCKNFSRRNSSADH